MSPPRLGVANLTAFLIFFSVFAVADVSAPNCTDNSYSWTLNSINQSPCTVTAYLMGTCSGGNFAMPPLLTGTTFVGPEDPDTSTSCGCSTVGYSLFSSCIACQGGAWISWSKWIVNCTTIPTPGTFPNPVPSGTLVPKWALIDVTYENSWNASESRTVGNNPELGPGAILGLSNASAGPMPSSTAGSSTTTSSTTSSTTPTTPIQVGHSSNSGAIAGGVVGGVAVISITVAAVFLYLRRRPREPYVSFDIADASEPYPYDTWQPPSDRGTVELSSLSGSPVPMTFHDAIDPTTSPAPPEYPGLQSVDVLLQGSTPSQVGPRGTLATTQTSSRGRTRKGYHDFPMPSA